MPLLILQRIPKIYLGRNRNGSITVFLSLVGILIFAMLGTLVETARFKACENHAGRTLRTSAEALLTEYSRPLYDNYGLFFIEDTGTPFADVISKYAGDTFETDGRGTLDFLSGQIQEITVTDKTYLGDDKAVPLQKEICERMMRTLTKKQLQKFLKKSSSFTGVEQDAAEIEETAEVEKQMAELDKELLELIKLIDGVTVSGGKIKVHNHFVKMFVTGEKKSQNFGITETRVWKKMKPKLKESPIHLDKLDKTVFLSQVKSVISLTKQACTLSEHLKTEYIKIGGKNPKYAEHDKKMGKLIQNLPVLNGNLSILKSSQAILEKDWTEEGKRQLQELWKGYDTSRICFDYTGAGEEGGADNPIDMLGKAWGDGILHLVCRDTEKISAAAVDNPDNYAELYEEQEESGNDCGDCVKEFTENESVNLSGALGDLGQYAMAEFCLDSYIQDKFSSYVEKRPGWKKALQYQWEYIAAGKKSDKANLEAVLNRILIIRTVINFAAIYKDSAKKTQAYGAAAAVVGFTGMEPLIRFMQTLILLVWSVVESLVDIAGLLQERDVPILKTPKKIVTTFPEIFQISKSSITMRAKKLGKATKKSFGYKEYLQLFLMTTKQSTKLYRIMDLIQWDMVKNGYAGFRLGNCVYAIEVEGKFSFPAGFFRFPSVQQMLNRQLNAYPAQCKIRAGYL